MEFLNGKYYNHGELSIKVHSFSREKDPSTIMTDFLVAIYLYT